MLPTFWIKKIFFCQWRKFHFWSFFRKVQFWRTRFWSLPTWNHNIMSAKVRLFTSIWQLYHDKPGTYNIFSPHDPQYRIWSEMTHAMHKLLILCTRMRHDCAHLSVRLEKRCLRCQIRRIQTTAPQWLASQYSCCIDGVFRVEGLYLVALGQF